MAPPFIARTVIGMSPCAVMKIIGRFLCAAESSHWRSRPLRPGILTSTTRQVGPSGAGSALKYSETHENCRLSSPTVRSSRPTESRNSASSSMIKTLGFASTQHPELKGHVFGPTASYSQSVGKNSPFSTRRTAGA